MIQAAISSAGDSTSRAISAATIKTPDPIMEPMTRVVALVSPRPFTSSWSAPVCEVVVFEVPVFEVLVSSWPTALLLVLRDGQDSTSTGGKIRARIHGANSKDRSEE